MSNFLISYFEGNPHAFFLFVGLLSLCVGSFLNVVIYRLPIMMNHAWRKDCLEFLKISDTEKNTSVFNLAIPRSSCPHCKNTIHAWQNIPLISYALLKGRCASCKTPISLRYPLIEFMTLLLSLTVAWSFGASQQTFFALLLTWGLMAMVWIDIDHQLLPDTINLALLWLGLLANLMGLFCQLPDAIIGAMAGYLSLWTCAKLFKWITGKDGMGHGDFKLLATLGAWVGWQLLPFIILSSTLFGSIIGLTLIAIRKSKRNTPIPFGPFLALAGWIALLWGNAITHAYLIYARLS
jgi:leader peptidase (prepilin peptidase)/N-methyltransferase